MSFIQVFKTIHSLKQKHFYVMIILIFIIGVFGLMYENLVGTPTVSQLLSFQHHGFTGGEHTNVIQILNVQTLVKLILSG